MSDGETFEIKVKNNEENQEEEFSDLENFIYDVTDGITKEYKVTVRKRTPAGSEQVDQWFNEYLSKHQVGLRHGAGRYDLFINIKDDKAKRGWKLRRADFTLGDHYNELARTEKLKTLNFEPNNNQNNEFDQFKKFAELMNLMKGNGNGNENSDNSILLEMYKQSMELNKTLLMNLTNKNNGSDTFKDMTEIFKQGITLGKDQSTDTTAPWERVANTIIENADKLSSLPKWLLSNKIQKAKASPDYQELIGDEEKFKSAIVKFDNKLGKVKTNKILVSFGLFQKAVNLGFDRSVPKTAQTVKKPLADIVEGVEVI